MNKAIIPHLNKALLGIASWLTGSIVSENTSQRYKERNVDFSNERESVNLSENHVNKKIYQLDRFDLKKKY